MSIIIIVDDEVSNYYLIEQAVQQVKGFNTFHADSSRNFFKLIKQVVPDFIFLKAGIPGPDAMYCIKKLRAISQYNAVPVIMYSTGIEYKKEAYRYRANLYIAKPDFYGKVGAAVNTILTFDWKNNFYPPAESLAV